MVTDDGVTDDGGRRAGMMRWGLIPFWARDTKGERSVIDARGKTVNTPINARAETLETAKSFSNAFRKRRCLIPADGYYEWRGPKNARRPMYIYPNIAGALCDGRHLGFLDLRAR